MNLDQLPAEIISRRYENCEDRDHELLRDHAEEVAERTARLGRFESERTSSDGNVAGAEENEEITKETVARCLGWLHDFGKVAPAFQLYVRDEYPNSGNKRYTYHARLGAFAAYYALGEMGASERDRLAAWGAILRHHGRLPDFAEATFRAVSSEQREDGHWAGPQIDQIRAYDPSRQVASKLLAEASGGVASWEGFTEAFETGSLLGDLQQAVTEGRASVTGEHLPEGLYDRTTRLWSSLTFADKTAAGEVKVSDLKPSTLELDRLEGYIESLQPDAKEVAIGTGDFDPTDEASLNVLREAARQRVSATAPELADAEVGTLTLPTGLGKTFTGITGAFELRDALAEQRDKDGKPTVVYGLPYTSIIEQTRDIFEDEEIFDADPRSNAFTVHHYLAETVTDVDSETQSEVGEAETDARWSKPQLLGESWRSGVVLTTFVQLFESLAGPTNGQGLKLPALGDAVIVLDEPQALPKHWWDAIRRLTRLLIDEYDARVISMTATQPTLFTDGDFDTQSLLELNGDSLEVTPLPYSETTTSFKRQASEAVARVRYDVHESIKTATSEANGEPISHEEAASEIAAATRPSPTESADGRSVLAVCNTIGSSQELTECIEAEFLSNGHSPTHVGAVYEEVLAQEDRNAAIDDLPDHEALTTQTLYELGFERDLDTGEWSSTGNSSDERYVATFNSRYRPLDRRVLIAVAEVLSTADIPFVLVSTQAIEAGVDISFARAYRDIAPLDSVVQTAGRCNRSFEWGPENGEVTVWTLDAVEDGESDGEEDRKPPSEYVYDGSVREPAADILLDLDADADGKLSSVTLEHDAVPRYFDAIEKQSLPTEKLVEFIEVCQAEKLGRRSLIGDSYETVDLLVAVTETDRERLDALGDAFEQHSSKGFDRLSDLADLRVSIPVRDLEEFLPNHVRADRSKRTDDEGVDVFIHRGNEGYGIYKLDGGGFVSDDGSGPSGRFTT
jgi:CRISPR-associated endonuclease/helicase Cas3/CRISPR-associated endonuclease Cas3-HD